MCDYNVKTLPPSKGSLYYWRFIDESGTLAGENFDNDDGDPGSIQWTPEPLIGAVMVVSRLPDKFRRERHEFLVRRHILEKIY